MVLIEAVGDEVTLFFAAILLLVALCLAWWTTYVTDRPIRIQTIIVGQRVIHVDERSQSIPGTSSPSVEPVPTAPDRDVVEADIPSQQSATSSPREPDLLPSVNPSGSGDPGAKSDEAPRPQSLSNPTVAAGIVSGSLEFRSSPADSPRVVSTAEEEMPGSTADVSSSSQDDAITVKLKFLNDTERVVDGRISECLAVFKRRHFSGEISAGRVVRLIFNGRLLDDSSTLLQCGLYHSCVLHCHVSAAPAQSAADTGAVAELALGALLYPTLVALTALVWGLYNQYPHMFSSTGLVLLALLTGLLFCFTVTTFLPNIRHHLQRLAAQRAH